MKDGLEKIDKLTETLHAYPYNFNVSEKLYVGLGMTLRDYFAAKAMEAVIAKAPLEISGATEEPPRLRAIASGAYRYADAMLEAREA